MLPAQVANKVAAGEVVERPASVVKEMVENSLDAGAERIEVTITAGGRKLIAVRDNGGGMNRTDALMCIERQSTSKIRDVHDIERIATLGFRGEAIPSIASVSRFTLKTRDSQSDAGTELILQGGTLQAVNDIGTPVGTVVEVRDLFYNVPARRKFLRAYQTEQGHIKNAFVCNALAHPEVGFTLSCDGRESYTLPSGALLCDRVRELFGTEYVEKLKPVESSMAGIRVYGYAGVPGSGAREREQQYVFVNRRPATAAVITYAVRQAYAIRDGGTRPALILFIEMEPGLVDVNVHPAKKEVRFKQSSSVREAVIAALSAALKGVVGAETQRKELRIVKPGELDGAVTLRSLDRASAAAASGVKTRRHDAWAPGLKREERVGLKHLPDYEQGFASPAVPLPAAPVAVSAPLIELPEDGAPWKWCRVIGELQGCYLLLETDSGCVTVDQRAAAERILYERLLEHNEESPPLSQKLLIPQTVRLAPADAERLRGNLEALNSMGFRIADFGDDHFMVEALPAVLGETDSRELLVGIAAEIATSGRRRGSVRWREELTARTIARTGASGCFKYSVAEAEKLVRRLAECRMPYTSPQGRPTMIFTAYTELERKFGKKR